MKIETNYKNSYKKIFNKEIDLIEEKNISNRYLRYFINKNKKLIMAYRNVSVWLEDIVNAIERIEIYIKDIDSLLKFLKITIDAAERNIEIIAEALKHAIKLEPQLPITNAKKLLAT